MPRKKEIRKYFMADFETTTQVYSPDTTKVWLYYIEEVFDEYNNNLGLTIDFFMSFVNDQTQASTIFFHNLNFDGENIKEWLADHANYVKPTDNRNGRTSFQINDWTFMADKLSNTYRIEYKNKNGYTITFQDSYKLISSSVSDLIPKELKKDIYQKDKIDYHITKVYNEMSEVPPDTIKYIKLDVKAVIPFLKKIFELFNKPSLTMASIARKDIVKAVGKESWDFLFSKKIRTGKLINGQYIEGEWDFLKRFYQGAWTYLNKQYQNNLIESHIYSVDENSMYSAQMRYQKLPYGSPIYHCKDKSKFHDHFVLIEGVITAKLKPYGVPFIPSGTQTGQAIGYLSEAKNHLIYTTKEMLDLIYKWYDVESFSIVSEVHFKRKAGIFDQWLDKWADMKAEAKHQGDSVTYKMAKAPPNFAYGKFAMSPLRKRVILEPYDPNFNYRSDAVFYGHGSKKMWLTYEEKLTSAEYIPMGIAITMYAKIQIIDIANFINQYQKYGEIGFLYSDTDSSHFAIENQVYLEEIKNYIELDDSKLGAFKIESAEQKEELAKLGRNFGAKDSWKYFFGLGRKKYIEFDDLDSTDRNLGMAGVSKDFISKYTNREIVSGNWNPIKLTRVKIDGGIILVEKEVKINRERWDQENDKWVKITKEEQAFGY